MIITQTDYERQGNSEARRRQGRVKEAKLGVFVQFMIKNYNKIELAVLREWVSNAYDSHRMAGQSKPVKVTLPSTFSNMLVVQDFGLGMSYDELVNGFGVILESTKDEDNEGIGGYGIGGKAALALADQFTVVSNKDGLKNIVIFESDARTGFEILEVVTDQPTDEPNGVTMSVAVENPDAFKEANSVLEGWRSDEIEIVNGTFTSFYEGTVALPSGVVKSSIFETHDSSDTRRTSYFNYHGRGKVFVGPVAYELPESYRNYFTWLDERKYSMVRYFFSSMAVTLPIGSVTFPSSREVIENNTKNNTVISEAFKALADEVNQYVKDNFMKFSSLEEAWSFRNSEFAERLEMNVTYKGRDLTDVAMNDLIYLFNPAIRASQEGITYNLSSTNTENPWFWSHDSKRKIPGHKIDSISTIVRLSNDENTPSISVVRKNVRAYLDKKFAESGKNDIREFEAFKYSNGIAVIGEGEIDPLWAVAGINVVEFADLREISKEAVKNAPRKTLTVTERRERVAEMTVKVVRKQSSSAPRHNDYGFSKISLNTAIEEAGNTLVLLPTEENYPADLVVFSAIFGLELAQFAIVPRKRDRERMVSNFPEVIIFEDYLNSLSKQKLAKVRARFTYLNRLRSDLQLGGYYERENLQWFINHENACDELKNIASDEDIRMASYVSASILRASENLESVLGIKNPRELTGYIQESPMTLYQVAYNTQGKEDLRKDMLDYLNIVTPRYKEKLDTLRKASV